MAYHVVERWLQEEYLGEIAFYTARSRNTASCGAERCLVSLARPFLSPDRHFYPCCGIATSTEPPRRGFFSDLAMCTIDDMVDYWAAGVPYDGSCCKVCFLDHYNKFLSQATAPIDHVEWI